MLEYLFLIILIALCSYYFLINYERFTNYNDKNHKNMSYKDTPPFFSSKIT